MTNRNSWPLVRIIIPAFPEVSIFTRFATALGPVMVATAANKLWGWRVEIIDENNYKGPRDSRDLPDHNALQEENPALVVGFYCGLSSTIERVWELAEFYHQEGVVTIAGGWHAHYCPEETLKNKIDIVVHGDGEIAIGQILNTLKKGESIGGIAGISFLENGQIKTNFPKILEVPDLNDLPYPAFGLLKHAKIKTYPIGRIRGCGMNCEFCSVRAKPHWASGQYLFEVVNWLVETRKARKFFIVDDRLEENLAGSIEFFKMVSKKYGRRLRFTVQVRLKTAESPELLKIMKEAGVRTICVGYESPIGEELKAMRKGYSPSHMLEWTKVLRRYFRIHAMFIFGYPLKEGKSLLTAKEMAKRFKTFIRRARPDTIQVMHPIPLVGTDLRQRLEKEGRIFPLTLVPWSKYDGSCIYFQPDNMTLREFQEIPVELMRRFYNPLSFLRIPLRTIAFPVDYLIRGWERWHRNWLKEIVKYGGHIRIKRWQKRQKGTKFIEELEKYQYQLRQGSSQSD